MREKKGKIKLFVRGTRPFSLTASAIPVILGGILAIKDSKFSTTYFMVSIIAIVLLQAAVNLLNDHDDFVNKVDTKDSHCSSGVVVEGLLTPKEVHKAGVILFILACLAGIFLGYKRGTEIFILAAMGAVCGYFYTGNPFKLKYKGLGAPLVFIAFGPLITIGSYYVQSQEFNLQTLVVSIPTGLLTTAILHANDIRDIKFDKRAGIKTLSIWLGNENAQIVYLSLIIGAYICLGIMIFYKYAPYLSLVCILTLPTAIKNINNLRLSNGLGEKIIELDKETGKLQAQFGVLFILAILVSLMW